MNVFPRTRGVSFQPRPAYEDSTMHITFADDAPVYDGDNLAVHFTAPVVCSISAEALVDPFRRGFFARRQCNGRLRKWHATHPRGLRGSAR